jgi:3-isopropylmalate dehydrogenase
MSRHLKIVLLPGDGVGPEVTEEGVRVLREIESLIENLAFSLEELLVGAGEFLRSGDPLSATVLSKCRAADAVLLGGMGLPDVRWPDGKEITPQIDLREQLQLYSGVRPIYLFNSSDTPLKNKRAGEIDFVIVRESTEGLFSGRLQAVRENPDEECDLMRITRSASERVFRSAFEIAMNRRKKVTLVDKANVLPSMVLFRKVFDDVADSFPQVQTERIYVDAAALFLVRRPESFDVLVTENIFGDILSDLAAGLVGGMGMAPSGDIGDGIAVFQPSHGSAPDIAGQGIANPTAMILSVAMMLHWLGIEEGALRIKKAVQSAFSNPLNRTPDMGGTLKTSELTDCILRCL